jgi:hypothetical protein
MVLYAALSHCTEPMVLVGIGYSSVCFWWTATEYLLPCIHKYGDAVRILYLHYGERLRTNADSWTTILFLFSKTSIRLDYTLSTDRIIIGQWTWQRLVKRSRYYPSQYSVIHLDGRSKTTENHWKSPKTLSRSIAGLRLQICNRTTRTRLCILIHSTTIFGVNQTKATLLFQMLDKAC